MTTRLLFKVTGANGEACHGGSGRWSLPTQKADGTWTPGEPWTITGALDPCHRGLHLCEPEHLIHWLGPVIHTVSIPEGVEEIRRDDKIVVRTARLERTLTTWNERTARHFACDCAEHVLQCTSDPRSAEAIRIARLFADGLISRSELTDAYAVAADAAADAAYASAYAAAYAAADANAERMWQTQRLMEYLRGERP